MPLLVHLQELRDRLLKAMLALIIGTSVGVVFAEPVLRFLQYPYGREFVILGPTGGVTAYLRIALTLGAIIAVPVITYQAMMFVLPGLTKRERRMVLMTLPGITLLFIIGAAFAWGVLIPPALGFLEGFQPTLFKPEWTADLYLNFVTALVFWMGVAFEAPLIFLILTVLGVVSASMLLKNWRIAIVVSAILAAAITPTIDPVNMALVMGPLLTLYIISILLSACVRRT
jgi:sec-independent protein translocase protein TatC